jgi:hypothetical protein
MVSAESNKKIAAVDSEGRTIWIADAHRGDGKRYVVHADELLTAFVELEYQTKQRQTTPNVKALRLESDFAG